MNHRQLTSVGSELRAWKLETIYRSWERTDHEVRSLTTAYVNEELPSWA